MSLQETLTADLKTAMLSHDSVAVSVLRLLQSEIKNSQIALGHSLEEGEMIKVIRKEVKKRQDTVTIYQNANQPDRAAAEEAEIAILGRYLPTQLDASIIETYIQERIQSMEEKTPRAKGELITNTLAHFGDQTDGKTVAGIVNRLLS